MFLDEQDVALRVESLPELPLGAADVDGEDADGVLPPEFAVWPPCPFLLPLFYFLLLSFRCINFLFFTWGLQIYQASRSGGVVLRPRFCRLRFGFVGLPKYAVSCPATPPAGEPSSFLPQ